MAQDHSCVDCKSGCAARHTEERTAEEIQAGPYLLFAAAAIVLLSLAVRWLV
ncbi:MAG: hypothetical protein HY914_23175 [Desulfomonile tiedjei]|nr:hypothetical protein [Desulfomonile tiedjei]